jgi:DsbC/DsbD-like thiol-disulfide interchange protein
MARPDRLRFSTLVYEPASSFADVKFARACRRLPAVHSIASSKHRHCPRRIMALARFPTLVALSVGFIMWTGSARAAATDWVRDSRATARLITATNHIAADSTLEAGLEFRFAKGWHGYWRTPGDARIPPTVDRSASENISGAEISWPAPHHLVIDESQNSVYENDVVLPVKLYLKQAQTSARIKASIAYAACSEICVPLQAELTLPLSTGAGGPSAESVLINSAQKQVPGSPVAAGKMRSRLQERSRRLGTWDGSKRFRLRVLAQIFNYTRRHHRAPARRSEILAEYSTGDGPR